MFVSREPQKAVMKVGYLQLWINFHTLQTTYAQTHKHPPT